MLFRQDIVENSTIWRFPMLTDNDKEPIVERSVSRGWDVLDEDRINALQSNATKQNIIDYFDGMNPSVAVAASNAVSRRHIVHEVIDHLMGIGRIINHGNDRAWSSWGRKLTVALQCAVDLVAKDNTGAPSYGILKNHLSSPVIFS